MAKRFVYYTAIIDGNSIDCENIAAVHRALKSYREINTIHSLSVFKHIVKPIKIK